MTHLQCFSTRLLNAIFSPTSVHTGLVRPILARSALTARTRPPLDNDPMFTINTSFLASFWTCGDHQAAESDSEICKMNIRGLENLELLGNLSAVTEIKWVTATWVESMRCKVWEVVRNFSVDCRMVTLKINRLLQILESNYAHSYVILSQTMDTGKLSIIAAIQRTILHFSQISLCDISCLYCYK